MNENCIISKKQIAEYNDKGALIIKGVLSKKEVAILMDSYNSIMNHQADATGIPHNDYLSVISQIRDLWKFDEVYHSIIFDSEVPLIAAQLMGRNAARLLHDHIISKPIHNSLEVPWHQDFPYWPTDNPNGLSIWLALDDVDEDSGSLEIIPGSHKQGEELPVDFIRNPNKSLNLNRNKVKLPVKKGDIVVLNSLTWHRTGPNLSSPNRRAYISLWIPPESRYEPLHSDWHPVNLNVKVKEGEFFNEDWFPIIGLREDELWKNTMPYPLKYFGPEMEDDELSMFNASRLIKKRLSEWLGLSEESDMFSLLLNPSFREQVCVNLKEKGILRGDISVGQECLKILSINSVAFTKFKARNVYNEAYIKFNELFQS